MKTIPFNKNLVFSVLLTVITFAIINRITPPHVNGVFNLVISKNRTSIANIHQQRDIEMSKIVKVDRINLAEKSQFRHPKLGEIGYSGDFFMDLDAPFTVKKSGDYLFFVSSDDGFILSVDGKQLCEWTHDRPLTRDTCNIHLNEGQHSFKLVYYQGYGNAGLLMNYRFSTDSSEYFMGDNSKYLSFY